MKLLDLVVRERSFNHFHWNVTIKLCQPWLANLSTVLAHIFSSEEELEGERERERERERESGSFTKNNSARVVVQASRTSIRLPPAMKGV